MLWLPSVDPLSEIRISPLIPDVFKNTLAFLIQISKVSASLRHGRRIVRSCKSLELEESCIARSYQILGI
jgi:hypothetical protein